MPFALFAFFAVITPGPTNLLALTQGQHSGWRSVWPFALASASAASSIVLLVVLGLANWLLDTDWIRATLAWAGTLWLSWLAISLARAPVNNLTVESSQRLISWPTGLALQVVNTKTWLMAVTISSLFADPDQPAWPQALHLAGTFFVLVIPAIFSWAWLGESANRLLHSPQQHRWMNRGLALALLATVWSALWMGQIAA
ncbi:LysE family translocator [Saccharospirillum mangrovi]|uniref:LysE family translocator n=1 Tax=Saccharospirillum mangrovi TaxID=2161747 RepID=UPI000D36B75E|nr:LysE family translocator [Saccharospirillum mangrovi]